MLGQRLRSVAFAGAVAALSPPAHADLAQLGDALADVATFGAWGQSRDTHRAQLELLKAQFAQQLQREANIAEARVATARIEEKARSAKFAQMTGSQLLIIVSTINVLEAQLKQIVVDRAKTNAVIQNFAVWFDSFVTAQSDQLQAFADLVKDVPVQNDAVIDAAVKSAIVALAGTAKDAQIARARLIEAIASSTQTDLQQVMGTLAETRRLLKVLIESQRSQVRQLVTEMHAEDVARRRLCTPPATIGVTCSGDTCSYFSPDPSSPLPCNNRTYLNAFPVSAVKDILDRSDAYRDYTEFYVSLMPLGTERVITPASFRSPKEVYGDDLLPSKLVPKDFIRSAAECLDVDRFSTRLWEALDYLTLFRNAQDRPEAARRNIDYALSLKPIISFWLKDFVSAIPTTGTCSSMPDALRRKRGLLIAAVEAVEEVGLSLTSGRNLHASDRGSLLPLTALSRDF